MTSHDHARNFISKQHGLPPARLSSFPMGTLIDRFPIPIVALERWEVVAIVVEVDSGSLLMAAVPFRKENSVH